MGGWSGVVLREGGVVLTSRASRADDVTGYDLLLLLNATGYDLLLLLDVTILLTSIFIVNILSKIVYNRL